MNIFEMIASLLRRIARFLDRWSSNTDSQEPGDSDQQTAKRDQPDSALKPEKTSTSYWQDIIHAQKAHRDWLRNNPVVFLFFLVLLIDIIITEQWLIQFGVWLNSQDPLLWDFLFEHRLALIAAGTFFLLYLWTAMDPPLWTLVSACHRQE